MLTRMQAYRLKQAGFLQSEIDHINDLHVRTIEEGKAPPTIDLTSGPWRSAMASRRDFIRSQRKAGASMFQIQNMLRDWYRISDKASPFDFVKAEYYPPTRVPQSDFIHAKKQREAARRRIRRGVHSRYPSHGRVAS